MSQFRINFLLVLFLQSAAVSMRVRRSSNILILPALFSRSRSFRLDHVISSAIKVDPLNRSLYSMRQVRQGRTPRGSSSSYSYSSLSKYVSFILPHPCSLPLRNQHHYTRVSYGGIGQLRPVGCMRLRVSRVGMHCVETETCRQLLRLYYIYVPCIFVSKQDPSLPSA